MTGLGHNSPPAHEAFAMEADELFNTASDTLEGMDAVQNEEQNTALDGLKDDLRRVAKDAEATRKAEKEPHLEAGRAVDAAYKPVADKCKKAIAAINAMQTPYLVAKQAERDEAARKAREEAERKEHEARAKLEADAPLEQRYEAEQEFAAAKKLSAVANKIDRSATGLRTYNVVEVTDRRAALNWIAKRDPDALSAFVEDYARRNAPTRPMDGVSVTQERRAA
jgi:hypothetical protein